jgi:hypothetical protein
MGHHQRSSLRRQVHAVSTNADIAAAIERFGALLEESQGDIALATYRLGNATASDDGIALGNRLAGVRWLDRDLYDALFSALRAAPDFDALTGPERPWFLPDRLVTQSGGRFGWAGDAALQKDIGWSRSEPDAHKAWHAELERYFAAKGSPLDQLYHALRGGSDQTVDLFRAAFADAAAKMDMSALNAALQTVRQPQQTGTPLAAAVQQAEAFYAGRSAYRRDYQLTSRFFKRHAAFLSMEEVLDADNLWIWHLHAAGGVGKTTFLRWLISRFLLSEKNAICARIDFDDYRLDGLVKYPLRAMAEILRQIDRQAPEAPLRTIVATLDEISGETGWNEGRLASALNHLATVRIERPIVVVLDTLEDATRTESGWLHDLIRRIGQLCPGMPQLNLILSGRNDFSAGVPAEFHDSMRVHELQRLSWDEAAAYLQQIEDIETPAIRQAMLDRVASEERDGEPEQARFTPFKLSLLSQIVRGDLGKDAEWIRRMESVDLAYLIERVILRIHDQALRWLIRYAAVTRQFDRGFLENVLLPELRETLLKGPELDRADQDALGRYASEDIWLRDPEVAAGLDADALLEQLRGYASDRGWISLDSGGSVIRLHPEVIEPTRALLARQPVCKRLHKRAVAHANALAKDNDRWIEAQGMLIFHSYQLDHAQGVDAWRKALDRARRHGRDALIAIAREIQSRDYEACDPGLRAQAHLVVTRVRIEQAIIARREDQALRADIVTGVENALRLAEDRVDPAYVALADLMQDRTAPRSLAGEGSVNEEAPVYLRLAMAWRLNLQQDWVALCDAWDQIGEARALERRDTLLTIDTIDLALWMNDIARKAQSSKRARAAMRSIGRSGRRAGTLRRSLDATRETQDLSETWSSLRAILKLDARRLDTVLMREAANALLDHDAPTALSTLPKVDHDMVDPQDRDMLIQLRIDCALATDDTAAAAKAVEYLEQQDVGGIGAETLIDAFAKAGFAAAIGCEFARAEQLFRRAEQLIEATDNVASAGKVIDCLILRARATLRGMRNPFQVERLLSMSSLSAQRQLLPDYEVQLTILRNWACLQQGRETASAMMLPNIGLGDAERVLRGSLWALAITCFGIVDNSMDHLFREVLNGPLPATDLFYRALEPAGDRTTPFPAHVIDRNALLDRLPKINAKSPTALIDRARQADLLRLLGMNDEAKALLELTHKARAGSRSPVGAMEYERCRGRLGLDTRFGTLAEAELTNATGGFRAVLAVLDGEDLVADGRWLGARNAIAAAKSHLAQPGGYNGWTQRVAEIEELAAHMTGEASESARLDREIQFQSVGLAPLMPHMQEQGVQLGQPREQQQEPTPPDAPPDAQATESVWIDRNLSSSILSSRGELMVPAYLIDQVSSWINQWLNGPEPIRRELAEAAWLDPVPPGALVKLNIEHGLEGTLASALPWELASTLDNAAIIRRAPRRSGIWHDRDSQNKLPGRILLPRRQSRFEGSSMGSDAIEHLIDLYFRRIKGEILLIGDLLESDLVNLARTFEGQRIEVVHLVASMQEAKGGFALDFSFGERSIVKSSFRSGPDPVLVQHLEVMLRMLGTRPLVILDIMSVGHDLADAEMLVQRNAFAEALYDPNLMRGLLATGLASYDDLDRNWSTLIDALQGGASVGELFRATRQLPLNLNGPPNNFYWPRATAFWCADPDAPALTLA